MKNLKYIALATIISVWALTATTFADDSNNTESKYMNMPNVHNYKKMSWSWMIHSGPWMNNYGSWMKDMKNNGQVMIEKYLKSDLTDVDKAAIATIKSNHETAMKALRESMKSINNSGATQEEMKTRMEEMNVKMKALHEEFVNALLPYIATDKVEEFKAIMAKMPVMAGWVMNGQKNWMDNGNQYWKDKKEDKQNIQNLKNQQVKIALPDSVVKALDKKIATFSTTDEKVTWLTSINLKIDTLLTKTLSEKSKNLLNALKNLINDRIETVSWTWINEDSIINLLQ